MKQVLSYIFNSSSPSRSLFRTFVLGFLGFGLLILAFEIFVSVLFPPPTNFEPAANSLTRYFTYGLSTEVKLEQTVKPEGRQPSALIRAGWVSTELYPASNEWKANDTRIIFYGMSFTNRIATVLQRTNPELKILTRAGPGAPLSHSYELFETDPERELASHIVVGVLSSSVPYLQAMTGLGYSFESPAPYTYPKFSMVNGQFKKEMPVITERDDFVSSFRSKSPKFKSHIAKIAKNDRFWNPVIYHKSWTDHSALLRLIRRYWASKYVRLAKADVYTKKGGYNAHLPSIAALPEILFRMQKKTKEANQKLIVVLLHARGEPGHLNNWVGDNLRAAGITVISSTDVFSSLNDFNFEKDGHYMPERDEELTAIVANSLK